MYKKGFTLTELLAVIAIIAILAVGALSGFSSMTKNSKEKSYETKVAEIETAAEKYVKENSITKKTTISVNKLVVLGYLQADDETDTGLATVKDPRNGENLICNLIDISIKENEVIVKFKEKEKNCSLANEEKDTSKIGVFAYCGGALGDTKPGGETYNTTGQDLLPWVRCERVILRTYPEAPLPENNIQSVSFDYGGNSNTKDRTVGMTTSNLTTNLDRYANLLEVKSNNEVLTNVDVGITYTLTDGKVIYRHVRVRIDKEKPTISAVIRNDTVKTNANSSRTFEIYADDGNGAGVVGYYYTATTDTTGATRESLTYKKVETKNTQLGTYYLTAEDAVGNKSDPQKVELQPVPGNLECVMNILNTTASLNNINRTNNWYNTDINSNQTTAGYPKGLNYGQTRNVVPKQKDLLLQVEKNIPVNYNVRYGDEMPLSTLYGGLWNVQNTGLATCTRTAGIDKTNPIVSIPNTYGKTQRETWKKKHDVPIHITDSSSKGNSYISGFALTGKTYQVKYAWALSTISTAPTSGWRTATLTPDATKEIYTVNGIKYTTRLTGTISDDKDYNNTLMTGYYRLWIKGVGETETASATDGSFSTTDSVMDEARNPNRLFKSEIFYIDNTPPKCESEGGEDKWYNTNRVLIGTCTDIEGTPDQSGCKAGTPSDYPNSADPSIKTTYPDNNHVRKEYLKDINARDETPGYVYDSAGNQTECPKGQIVKIDTVDPTCSVDYSGTTGNNGWYKKEAVSISLTKSDSGGATDGGSGIVSYGLTNTNSKSYNSSASNTQGNTTGATWYGWVKDDAGNEGKCNKGVKVDTTKPTCTVKVYKKSGDAFTAEVTGWQKVNVKVKATCSDTYSDCSNSNSKSVRNTPYKSGEFGSNTNANKHASSNNTKLTIYDNAGNGKDCDTVTVQVDKGDPTCTPSHSGSTGKWSCSDDFSGISGNTSGTETMTGTSHTITHTCTDNAGRTGSCNKTYVYGESSKCGTCTACHDNDGCTLSCEDWPGTTLTTDIAGTYCKLCINSGDCSMWEHKPYKEVCTPCSHTCCPTCWHD